MRQVTQDTKDVVILAAGYGSRLSNYSNGSAAAGKVNGTSHNEELDKLKPLTEVGGTPLIFRTLHNMEYAGVQNAHIVIGYKGEVLRQKIADNYTGNLNLNFMENEEFDLNNGVSLLKVRDTIDRPFILTMADHVFEPAIARIAGRHKPVEGGATLLVDYKVDSIFDIDDATKVKAEHGKLQDIGKNIPDYNCIDSGIFVATPALFDHLEQIYNKKGDVSLSEGVKLLADEDKMRVLDIEGAFWQDIDTPEMLKYAEWVLQERQFVYETFKAPRVK